MTHATHITTFYSFKGGVGRTLLLANVGAYLARHGRRVLLWDLDVEAPGMHLIPELAPASPLGHGFLEWLHRWQTRDRMKPPAPEGLDRFMDGIYDVPHINGLHLMPAIGDKADAAGLYQDIHWHDFLVARPQAGLDLMRGLLDHLRRSGRFHHILLDARTGITDLGGLMTAVLPHATVLVGSYGAQNLSGLRRVHKALQPAAEGRIAARQTLPPLQRLVVISPVPQDQNRLRDHRRMVWNEDFPFGPQETRVEIPFDSRLLFTEDLLGIRHPESAIARKYAQVALQVDGFLENLETAAAAEQKAAAAYPDQISKATSRRGQPSKEHKFEERVARLLTLLGYEVEPRQEVDGHRIDLIARKKSGLRSECLLVACKDHPKAIGQAMIDPSAAWLDGQQARQMHAEAMVVAQGFSPAGRSHADASGILIRTPQDLENALFDFGPYLSRLMRAFEESELARTYVPHHTRTQEGRADGDPGDLLEQAMDWARGRGRRLRLLLGDNGAGKTSFFKRFAYQLAQHHRQADRRESPAPVPIAVDLRAFPNTTSLKGLIQEHMRDTVGWHGNPEIILHLLDAGRVVLLLDAFDEMGATARKRSIEEQFRILARPTQQTFHIGNSRVMIISRTQFFLNPEKEPPESRNRSGQAPLRHDTALGRLARTFNAAIDLLPAFNTYQMAQFLEKRLSASSAREAVDEIQKNTALAALAARPVLLDIIVKTLPEILQAGTTPASLYHCYTRKWLTDQGDSPLQATPEQREQLLEQLAYELWSRPRKCIHYRQLIRVLERLSSRPLVGFDPERVDLELRTAAFLFRTAAGDYGFSHSSFMAYFLARHMLRALRSDPQDLSAAMPRKPLTSESCTFLADMLEIRTDHPAFASQIRNILGRAYRPGISENALRLAYHVAQPKDRTAGQQVTRIAALKQVRIDLTGAKLEGEQLPGIELAKAKLSQARLSGADLTGANLEGADLTGADLTHCRLDRIRAASADFSNARLTHARAVGARMDNARLTGASLTHANLEKATLQNAEATNADLTEAKLDGADLTGIKR